MFVYSLIVTIAVTSSLTALLCLIFSDISQLNRLYRLKYREIIVNDKLVFLYIRYIEFTSLEQGFSKFSLAYH